MPNTTAITSVSFDIKSKKSTHIYSGKPQIFISQSQGSTLFSNKAPRDYRRFNLHENLADFFLSAAEE